MKTTFRFETLNIWKRAAALSLELFSFADFLERRKLFRFAEQLRGSVLSITNNLAEGSGSASKREFAQFVNFARRSVFETANMLLIFEIQKLVTREQIEPWLAELEALSKMLESFRKTLTTVFKRAAAVFIAGLILCSSLFALRLIG